MRRVAMEFGTWRCERSGSTSGSIIGGNGRSRAAPGTRMSRGGNGLRFGDQESVGRDAETGVMMEAAPSSALIVIKPDRLLQLEIVALDPPAELGQIDQALECDVASSVASQ